MSFDNSLGREINRTLFGDISIEVAAVDISLGQTERLMVAYNKSYLSFYRAYRTYCILEGIETARAAKVLEYVKYLRYSYGSRFVAVVEIYDKIESMGYSAADVNDDRYDSFFANLSRHIKLGQKEVLNVLELKFYIGAAVSDAKSVQMSKFISSVASPQLTEAELGEVVFVAIMCPISVDAIKTVFSSEKSRVDHERKLALEAEYEVRSKFKLAVKSEDPLNRSLASPVPSLPSGIGTETTRIRSPDAAAAGVQQSAVNEAGSPPERRRSVHFSPENNIIHEMEETHNSASMKPRRSKRDSSSSESQSEAHVAASGAESGFQGSSSSAFSVKPTRKSVDRLQHFPSRPESSAEARGPSLSGQSAAVLGSDRSPAGASSISKRNSFFTRAAQVGVSASNQTSPPSRQAAPLSSGRLPMGHSPIIEESPPSSPPPYTDGAAFRWDVSADISPNEKAAKEGSFRIGDRSLLIMKDADGKKVSVRPLSDRDVIDAFRPRVFAFGAFLYLFQEAEKKRDAAKLKVIHTNLCFLYSC
jgi:hypothetical protein